MRIKRSIANCYFSPTLYRDVNEFSKVEACEVSGVISRNMRVGNMNSCVAAEEKLSKRSKSVRTCIEVTMRLEAEE